MQDFAGTLLLAFIPLFVAIDPIGLAAIFLALGREATPERKHRVAVQATLTGGLVSLLFLFLGTSLFSLLGISVKDFQIAGGLILFILAAKDLVGNAQEAEPAMGEDFGVVPLGMPLIAGPATIATLLLLNQSYGLKITLTALALNLLLVVLAFIFCVRLIRPGGGGTLRAISKIISLLLAAIAVNMIRRGL
jgi:multiple antibiotic resistance protein